MNLFLFAGLLVGAQATGDTSAGQTAVPPTVTPAAARSNANSKVICRKFPVIGSLVLRKQVCATKAEWDLDYTLRRLPTVTNSCRLEGVC